MIIRLKLDRMTIDDLIALEDNNQSARMLRNVLSRYVVDEAGNYLPEGEAQAQVGGLALGDLKAVTAQFAEQLKELQATALPPVSGGS